MAPFLDEVDLLFAEKHLGLLDALDVRPQPALTNILEVQRELQPSTSRLSASGLNVAVSSLEIAIRLCKLEELTEVLVPDTENVMRSLPDIVHGDQYVSGPIASFNHTHSALSTRIIQVLGVENALARATRLNIEFEDEDEDEYTPREKLTGVISDTLERYPIESTFNEYLANADDCGATKISWILDQCLKGPHDSLNLLTPELKPFQGPALFVHNDEGKLLS